MEPGTKHPAYLAFVLTIGLMIALVGYFNYSTGILNHSSTSSNSLYGGTSVTNSSGSDICCHYVGSDPTPIGCNTMLGTAMVTEGYSLEIYVSSQTVAAGGDALCISPVLHNVNGTVLTYGTREGRVSIGFNVTAPNGNIVYQDDCFSYSSPPNYMSSYNKTEMDFGCTGVWYTTGAAPGGGLTPTATIIQAGTYHISCTATFPGLGGIDTKANETVTGSVAVIASSTG